VGPGDLPRHLGQGTRRRGDGESRRHQAAAQQLTLGFFAILVGAGLIFEIPEITGVGTALGLVNLGVIVSETVRLGRILKDTYDIVAAGLGLRAVNGTAKEKAARAA